MSLVSPGLIDLIVELHRLGPGDRRAILGRLEEEDRRLVLAQLERIRKRSEPSFDALASLSPWLAESLAAARAGEPGLTHATREALLDAERLLPSAAQSRGPVMQRWFKRKALA